MGFRSLSVTRKPPCHSIRPAKGAGLTVGYTISSQVRLPFAARCGGVLLRSPQIAGILPFAVIVIHGEICSVVRNLSARDATARIQLS